jgi:hypothetical protein
MIMLPNCLIHIIIGHSSENKFFSCFRKTAIKKNGTKTLHILSHTQLALEMKLIGARQITTGCLILNNNEIHLTGTASLNKIDISHQAP